MSEPEHLEDRVARCIHDSLFVDGWESTLEIEREAYRQVARAVLLLLRPGRVEVRDEKLRSLSGEQVPDGLTFSGLVTFNRLEFEQARQPEALIDSRLAHLKVKLLERARDLMPPPAFFPKGPP